MEPVAIIGLGCRFPGAANVPAFWQLLCSGTDAISLVPADRWDGAAFYDPDPAVPGKISSRWGGFLEEIDGFDAAFFKISPREAIQIDPQQRLLLEVAWEALEDAGQVAEQLAGQPVGVFVGIMSNDYGEISRYDPELVDAYTCPGNGYCIAANRLSYTFDFRGPSMAVDTACSSSLVAVDLACASLERGECELAVVGGVNILLSPWGSVYFTKASLIAPDGRCKPFDARANGIVRGEGAGVVILKRLSAALRDGDGIYAVIRGAAVNQDGRTNGLTAPNRWAQEAVLRAAYRNAGLSPGAVQYVEAHGTGTALGDPIEAKALGVVLATNRPPEKPCWIGSVKSNIGHLESAAGIAGLIKVALCLKYKQIPPNLHFQTPHPHIPFDQLPLRVPQTLLPWPDEGGPALAGVSSFGFGGTNAHVVLEEAPAPEPAISGTATHHQPHLLLLSARGARALQELARDFRDFLTGPGALLPLADICFTAGVRREHHPYRLALIGYTQAEMVAGLDAYLQGEQSPRWLGGHRKGRRRFKVVFITPGQRLPVPNNGELDPDVADVRVPLGDLAGKVEADPALLAAVFRAWGLEPAVTVDGSEPGAEATMAALVESGHNVFVALSRRSGWPASISGLLQQHGREGVVLPASEEEATPAEALLRSLGALYVAGYPVHWAKVYSQQGRIVSLSTYPWQHERFWLAPANRRAPAWQKDSQMSRNPLLGKALPLANLPAHWVWEVGLDHPSLAYLLDHQVQGRAILPGAAYIEMVLAAIGERFNQSGTSAVAELSFIQPLQLSPEAPPAVQLTLTREESGGLQFHIYSHPAGGAELSPDWTLHAAGRVDHGPVTALASQRDNGLAAAHARRLQEISGQTFYEQQGRRGNQWGPCFQGVQRLWLGEREALAEVSLPQVLAPTMAAYYFHPALLDACGHALAALAPGQEGAFVLSRVDRVEYYGRPGQKVWSHIRLQDTAARHVLQGDMDILDEDGRLLAALRGVHFHYLAGAAAESSENLFYCLEWIKAPALDQPEVAGQQNVAGQQWLIFADSQGTGQAVRSRLVESGVSCTLVFASQHYQALTPQLYQLNPTQPAHFARLMADLGASGQSYDGLLHLWSLDTARPEETTLTSLRVAQVVGCASLLHLVQALARSGWSRQPRLVVVTRRAQAVGVEPVSVAQTPLWGLGRTILGEYPELCGQLVDLDTGEATLSARALRQEIGAPGRENQVAWRAGQRYVARLMPYTPEILALPPQPEIQAQATYLITGGLGDLGLKVAHWLAGQGARHLILLGRSALPPRSEWDRAGGDQPGARLAAVKALEEMGVQVYLASVDVAEEDELRSWLEAFEAVSPPPLRGVIHAAGVVERKLLADLDHTGLYQILRPKVSGGWLLHKVLEDRSLDFFILFSSASSLLSSPFLGAYAAANAFLDGLAHYRRSQGLPALSINWGPWAETGMAAREAQRPGQSASQLLNGLVPAQGLAALAALMGQTAPQVAVMSFNRAKTAGLPLLERPAATALAFSGDEAGPPAENVTPEALMRLTTPERQPFVEAYLRQQIAEVLKHTAGQIDVQTPLSDLGMDSLMALALQKRIESHLGVTIPIATFYEGVNLAQLAADILAQVQESAILETNEPDLALGEQAGTAPQTAMAPEEAARLLDNLETLSNEEVDALLHAVWTGEEK
ncbi:MAG: polyketide synthase dehydratase domain-containing protein [Chloroflexi bacterium]|nr:polyketide synthase dehydratase domain-containing protein [Chloroflexota bacterium]MCI0578242.1 polyketide synthase dehydratase domain-containing protein [Chloroflexota bacterium]MCI0649680.1 polyketide synthase dehydratase domain-containing protein [Chloroflexota bacterium]MCI0728840.1 polyketide synthase dehydratase domain-containing protein [Chloroflexota bacterium]